jgi:mono/diheme cytochrome c family protein
LSIFKPPYGTISAINMDKGEIAWQVAHGETPDVVRNHETLKGMAIPRTGQPGFLAGTLVTKTLVIAGDQQVTTLATRARGAMLRAYDKATGAEVGAVLLPAQTSGSPMTYAVNGRQYIVVAVSGGAYSGEYIALRLPATRSAGGDVVRRATSRSVWDSVFTLSQAARGEASYGKSCARCHQASLGGADETPALTGSGFLGNWNGLTLGDLHDRIRKTMPTDSVGIYDRQLVTDVIAFVLKANGFPAGSTELASDTDVLKDIRVQATKP